MATEHDSGHRTETDWTRFMADAQARVAENAGLETRGTLTRLTGLVLEATGIKVPVGSQCLVQMPGHEPILSEVVGFSADKAFLMPAGDTHGLSSGASVSPAPPYVPVPRLGEPSQPINRIGVLRLPMGDGLLGRVVDSQGLPLDHGGPIRDVKVEPMDRRPINAMDRDPVREPLDTGIRAINALLTVGRGQRLGLFAGSGVGKSVLLGMMARYTQADVIAYATAVAEHFRDKGQHVLLLMDSLTRYAMAQREIALAIGEPPATKGYPPSCFAKLPQLVERSGNGLHGVGSITAFYTVLSEGDDQQDPIADAARAILDGHIVLSRALAEMGHFPAIDIEQSASRVMHNVVTREHFEVARQFRAVYSRYQKSRDLVQVGAYVSGSDPSLDAAIRLQPAMAQFLQQNMFEAASLEESCLGMAEILS